MIDVVAVTIILVLHVGVIGHHVPCRYDVMFPAVRTLRACAHWGVRDALPLGQGLWEGSIRNPQSSKWV